MREFIRITDETLHWFSPLLSEDLCRQLTQQKSLYAIGAVEDRVACGILVFCIGKPAAEIRMLVVSPEYRRRGIARRLQRKRNVIIVRRHRFSRCRLVDGKARRQIARDTFSFFPLYGRTGITKGQRPCRKTIPIYGSGQPPCSSVYGYPIRHSRKLPGVLYDNDHEAFYDEDRRKNR